MSKQVRIALALKAFAIALVFTVSSQAVTSTSRSFVSTTGSDTNTAAFCSAAAPCRSFGAALSVTSVGGEIVVLSSGGYGPATITQSVVITAVGVDAGISQTTSGQNGLNINTGGNVTLVGLNLHGEGAGMNGLNVSEVAILRLYNVTIESFTNDGVNFGSAGSHVDIYDSRLNDNGGNGLELPSIQQQAYVHNTSFDHNGGNGVLLSGGGSVTIADSSADGNGSGFTVLGGNLALVGDRAMFNATGLTVSGGASALNFAYCLVTQNTSPFSITGGATLAGTNPGTNLVTGTGTGTPATVKNLM